MLAGIILNHFIALSAGAYIRYVPLKRNLRVTLWGLFLIYGVIFCAQSLLLVIDNGRGAPDYLDGQLYQTLSGLITMMLPFFLIRKSFFQNLFLVAVVANYSLIVFGAGNFAELAFGGGLAKSAPYLISNAVKLFLSALLLPPVIRALKKLFALWPDEKSVIWRMYWIVPALFAGLCLLVSGFFHGKEFITTLFFVFARLIMGAGCIVACILMARAFKQEARSAVMAESARMMEHRLALERDQYVILADSVGQAKAARHDLRHHVSVLKQYHACGDFESLGNYLSNLNNALPAAPGHMWCENYAVNAVAAHYLASAEAVDAEIDARLDVPEHIEHVSDTDLCVVFGNLLENATEAVRMDIARTRKRIKVRSLTQGDYLCLMVENTYDGQLYENEGMFLSRKERKLGGSSFYEGVGLQSVRAVCGKYNGMLKIKPCGDVFRAYALLSMGKGTEN